MSYITKIGVIGLGYVGLPLALEFSKLFNVIGYDINQSRLDELKKGIDKNNSQQNQNILNSNLSLTSDIKNLEECNVFIITVPTPISENKYPNFFPLTQSTKLVAKLLKKGTTVIFESTVHPGATEEICIPILEEISGLKINLDFFVGYSPERINPGDNENTLTNIKKIVSGSSDDACDFIDSLYSKIIKAGTHKAPTIKVAEASKILENVQRDVNIALMNEALEIFNELEINIDSVIEAASTKWNFMRFYPGLVGGHCIGVDPYYLIHKASEKGVYADLMIAARKINENASKYHARKFVKKLFAFSKFIKNKRILILGATFKPNCPDLRNSKIEDLWKELKEYGFQVDVFDPEANQSELKTIYGSHVLKKPKIDDYSGIVLGVFHNIFKKNNSIVSNLNKFPDIFVYKI